MRALSLNLWMRWAPAALFCVLLALAAVANPVFQSSDDSTLGMLGGGFGLTSSPEPRIMFANYLYGLMIGAVSWALPLTAHAWLTVVALATAAAVVLTLACQKGVSALPAGLFAAFGVFATAILHPQFTTTAAALTVASVMAAAQYARTSSPRWFFAAVLLLFLSGIIRWESVGMLALAALPVAAVGLASWDRAHRARIAKVFGAALLLIGGAALFDVAVYMADPAWAELRPYFLVRALFIDLRSVPFVEGSAVYAAAGWSKNDYIVFTNWYSRDPLFSYDNIKAIATAHAFYNSPANFLGYLYRCWRVLSPAAVTLFFLTVVAAGMVIFAARDQRRYILAGALGCALALMAIFMAGRPPLERICLSLIIGFAGLICWTAWHGQWPAGWRRVAQVFLIAAAGLMAIVNIYQARKDRAFAMDYGNALTAVQPHLTDRTVFWGSAISANYLMSMWGAHDVLAERTMVGIGASLRAPYVDAILATWGVTDFSKSLCTDRSITIIARKENIAAFQDFCRARYNPSATYGLVVENRPFMVWRLQG